MTKRRWTAKSGYPSCGVTNGCLETPDEQNDDPDGCGGAGTRRWRVVVACIGCGGGERDGAWFLRRRAGTRRQASAADRLRPGHAGAFSALLRNAAGRRVHHPWPHGSRGRPGTAVPRIMVRSRATWQNQDVPACEPVADFAGSGWRLSECRRRRRRELLGRLPPGSLFARLLAGRLVVRRVRDATPR